MKVRHCVWVIGKDGNDYILPVDRTAGLVDLELMFGEALCKFAGYSRQGFLIYRQV